MFLKCIIQEVSIKYISTSLKLYAHRIQRDKRKTNIFLLLDNFVVYSVQILPTFT